MVDRISSGVPAASDLPRASPARDFGAVLKAASPTLRVATGSHQGDDPRKVAFSTGCPASPGAAAQPVQGDHAAAAGPTASSENAPIVAPGRAAAVSAAQPPEAVRLVAAVALAQKRLDHILRLAESGKTFTPAELIALQAHAYRAGQELDLAGKVVEKATSAVKQTLQTQV